MGVLLVLSEAEGVNEQALNCSVSALSRRAGQESGDFLGGGLVESLDHMVELCLLSCDVLGCELCLQLDEPNLRPGGPKGGHLDRNNLDGVGQVGISGVDGLEPG